MNSMLRMETLLRLMIMLLVIKWICPKVANKYLI